MATTNLAGFHRLRGMYDENPEMFQSNPSLLDSLSNLNLSLSDFEACPRYEDPYALRVIRSVRDRLDASMMLLGTAPLSVAPIVGTAQAHRPNAVSFGVPHVKNGEDSDGFCIVVDTALLRVLDIVSVHVMEVLPIASDGHEWDDAERPGLLQIPGLNFTSLRVPRGLEVKSGTARPEGVQIRLSWPEVRQRVEDRPDLLQDLATALSDFLSDARSQTVAQRRRDYLGPGSEIEYFRVMLFRAMIAFVIAHELGHVRLGHLSARVGHGLGKNMVPDAPGSEENLFEWALEFDADRFGLEAVLNATFGFGEQRSGIDIAIGYFACMLVLRIIEVLEVAKDLDLDLPLEAQVDEIGRRRRAQARIPTSGWHAVSHPPAWKRRQRLRRIMGRAAKPGSSQAIMALAFTESFDTAVREVANDLFSSIFRRMST